MRQQKFWLGMSGILAVSVMALMLPAEALAASKFHVLYRFANNVGGNPTSVALDAAGNLYGTAQFGAASDRGIVFKLKPNSDGSWTESTLYAFCSLANCADGRVSRRPARLRRGGKSLRHHPTRRGFELPPPYGCGTVFKLKPNWDGSWTESVLHSFTRGADGFQPVVGVIFDTSGNLYGTTISGGPSDDGTVFQLKPNSDGSWTESVLYSFCSLPKCGDGATPYGGVIADAAGNLYVAASLGGDLMCNGPPYGCGAVIRLKPNSDGSWTESLLYSFKGGADGSFPSSGLIFDEAGSLYGVTPEGGGKRTCQDGCGTVFKLKPNSDGSWTESVLHRFANNPGANPFAGLTFDASGNLYGTTAYGVDSSNCTPGCGTVFKLTANSNGSWALHTLHTFLGKPAAYPGGTPGPRQSREPLRHYRNLLHKMLRRRI